LQRRLHDCRKQQKLAARVPRTWISVAPKNRPQHLVVSRCEKQRPACAIEHGRTRAALQQLADNVLQPGLESEPDWQAPGAVGRIRVGSSNAAKDSNGALSLPRP
jgi:hypothetical protein